MLTTLGFAVCGLSWLPCPLSDSLAHTPEVCSVVIVVSTKSPGVGIAKRAELSVGRPVSVDSKSIKHHMSRSFTVLHVTPDMVVHSYRPRIQKAEMRKLATVSVWDQHGKQGTLSKQQ